MPMLTRLSRVDDICLSKWKDPRSSDVLSDVPTPMTAGQREAVLQGATPPKPAGVPASYVFVSARLERMFSNGRQEILPNEIGDVSGWDGSAKSQPLLRAVIQEVGEDPVDVVLAPSDYTETGDGRITTTKVVESDRRATDRKIIRYSIIGNSAVKVGER